MGRWQGFEEMSSLNMNGSCGQERLPRSAGQIGSQAGVISPSGPRYQLLPEAEEAPEDENMCKSSSPTPSARRFIKKVMSMAIGRRTVGCRLHLPNWEAKYGGRTPLSGSLNKRPFWIFM